MNTLIRILIVFLLVLFVFSVGINVAVNSLWLRAKLERQFSQTLKEQYNLKTDFTNLQLSVIPPRAGVYGFALSDIRTGEVLARASRIDANVSFVDLLFGRKRAHLINVSNLHLNEPIEKIIKRFQPKTVKEKKPIAWPPSVSPPFRRLRVINFSGLYSWTSKSQRKSKYEIKVQGASFSAVIHHWNWIDLDSDINGLHFSRDEGTVLENAILETKLHFKNGFITSDLFKVESEKMRIDGGVKGTFLNSKPVATESNSLFDKVGSRISKRRSLMDGFKLDIEGNLRGDLGFLGVLIRAKNTYGPIRANAKFSIRQGVAGSGYTGPGWSLFADVVSQGAVLGNFNLLDSKGLLEMDAKEIRFRDFEVIDGAKQLMKGSGSIELVKPGKLSFVADAPSMRLSNIMKITQAKFNAIDFEFLPQEITVEGQVLPFQMNIKTTKGLRDLTAPSMNIVGKKKRAFPGCAGTVEAEIDKHELVIKPTVLRCRRPDVSLPITPIRFFSRIPFRNHSKLDVSLDTNALQLGILSPFFAVDAKGAGSMKMKVTSPKKSSAKISIETNLRDTEIAKLPLGVLTGSFSIEQGRLKTKSLRSYNSEENFLNISNATMGLDKNVDFLGLVSGKGFSGSDLKSFFDYVFQGSPPLYFGIPMIDGIIKGPLLKPLRWGGSVSMELDDLEQDNRTLLDRLNVKLVRNQGGALQLPTVEASYRGKRLQASGAISRSSNTGTTSNSSDSLSFPLKVVKNTLLALGAEPGEKISLQGSAAPNTPHRNPFNVLRLLPVGAQFAETFKANADGFGRFTLGGTVAIPRLDFSGKVTRLQMHGYEQPATNLELKMSGADIVADFDQPGLLEGRFKNRNENFELDLEAKGTNIGWLAPQHLFTDKNAIDVITDLNWKTSGRTVDFWHANGALDVTRLVAYFKRDAKLYESGGETEESLHKSVKLVRPVRVITGPKGWNLEQDLAEFRSQNIQFTARTTANDLPSNIGLSVDGAVDLSILPRFNDLIESGRGLAPFQASLAGALDKPIIDMHSVNTKPSPDTEFVVRGFYPGFNNLAWDIGFDSGLVLIKKFNAQKGSGSIRAQGDLLLDRMQGKKSKGLKVIGAGMEFRMPAPYLKSVNATLSTDLFLSGNKPPYLISGTTSLDSGFANRDFDLEEEVLKALRAPKYAAPKNVKPMFKYSFDMDFSRGFRLTNNNINSTLRGDLAVRGTSTKPQLRGRLYMDGGTFSYKREFNISRANIEFANSEAINPELDISGYTDLPGRRIYLTIQGPLSKANVDMVADPATRDDGTPLSKLDVFILLTTGALPSQSELAGRRGSAAQVELINFFASTVNRPLERLMEISGQRFIKQPSLEFELSEATGQIIPKLKLPIDVYDALRMNVGINSQGSWEVSSEVPLNRSISLSGSLEGSDTASSTNGNQVLDDKRDAALDMNFRFRFK